MHRSVVIKITKAVMLLTLSMEPCIFALLSVTDYSGHVRACHVHICMLCEQPFGMSASQKRLFYHTEMYWVTLLFR